MFCQILGLYVFPVFKPLVVGWEPGPRLVHRLLQFRRVGQIDLPPLHHRLCNVVHLMAADKSRYGYDMRITEYIPNRQARPRWLLLQPNREGRQVLNDAK